MLQLDLIKKHILPKTCSQHYEIKIVNSKKCDEQLNLAKSFIKNKLFEKSNEFKSKFQQHLQIKFNENDDIFKNTIFADPWLYTEKKNFMISILTN